MKLEPITLTGELVRLEPLEPRHTAGLFAITHDQQIWTYLYTNLSTSQAKVERWIDQSLEERKTGTILRFVIVELATNTIVGSTSYLDFSEADRGVEIGWTWLSPAVQRTGINTECKYLLLRHAFETLGMIRVQLKTHHLNLKSQKAIERIGATREGVLRNHKIMPDGSYRHSVYFSIIESEWPQVKTKLEAMKSSYK